MLKVLLLVSVLAMLISLFTGLFFLFKDQGKKKRLVYALFARVFFASLVISLVVYALFTGQLQPHSPINIKADHDQSSESIK